MMIRGFLFLSITLLWMACQQSAKKSSETKVNHTVDSSLTAVDRTKSESSYNEQELDALIDRDTFVLMPNYPPFCKMTYFTIKKSVKGASVFNKVLAEDVNGRIESAKQFPDNSNSMRSILEYLSPDRMSVINKTMLNKDMKGGHTEFNNYVVLKGKAEYLQFRDLFKKDIFIGALNYDMNSDSILIGVPDELKVDCLNFSNLVKGNGSMTEVPQIEFSFHKDGIQIHFYRIVSSDGSYPLYKFIYDYENKIISYKLLKPYLRDDLVFLAQ